MMIRRVPRRPSIGSMKKISKAESSRLKWLSVKPGQVAEMDEVDEVAVVEAEVAAVDLVVAWEVIEAEVVVAAVVVKEIGPVPTLPVATITLAGVMLVTFATLLKKEWAPLDLVDPQVVQVVSVDEVDPVVAAPAWVTEAVVEAWVVAEEAWVTVEAVVAWATEV